MQDPFVIIEPEGKKIPFVLSIPHCGIQFPSELVDQFVPEQIEKPDDTDWFLPQLYDFATELGITIIHARYSRWVIDLNRDPESKPLYDDGRIITGLTPTTDFFGKPIYNSSDSHPDQLEIERRLNFYYWPYYQKLNALLQERIAEFGDVILWDAHSIRHYVPTIRAEIFPDMILGSNDERSASLQYIQATLNTLRTSELQVNHNDPFKGGHITRYFGKPENGVHALQLEMNKILYMDDAELNYHSERADRIKKLLKQTFEALTN
jgi:N-formylglutamate deformylase